MVMGLPSSCHCVGTVYETALNALDGRMAHQQTFKSCILASLLWRLPTALDHTDKTKIAQYARLCTILNVRLPVHIYSKLWLPFAEVWY